ncbi:hypothetical protein T265_16068, partial [Opisthorchis viverrini]
MTGLDSGFQPDFRSEGDRAVQLSVLSSVTLINYRGCMHVCGIYFFSQDSSFMKQQKPQLICPEMSIVRTSLLRYLFYPYSEYVIHRDVGEIILNVEGAVVFDLLQFLVGLGFGVSPESQLFHDKRYRIRELLLH